MGLPNCLRVLAYSTVISSVRCMPPAISAASATVAMSSARARGAVAFAEQFRWRIVEFHVVELARQIHAGHGSYFHARALWLHEEHAIARRHDDEIRDGGIRDKQFLAGEFAVGHSVACVRVPASARLRAWRQWRELFRWQMAARYFFCARAFRSVQHSPARTTVERNAPGNNARPISSISASSSTLPRPMPPYVFRNK